MPPADPRGQATSLPPMVRVSTDDVSKTVENAVYTAVGLGILGFQHLQVQRRQLQRALRDLLAKSTR
jgi:hypothetical protein